jgi:GNAT superfamily N-acetyltransferase
MDGGIRAAETADAETVRELFREYAAALEVDLSFQDFEAEVADPLGFYELVLLAEGGCVALRRIDPETCEMKRLYVRPESRGGGLGRRLAAAVVAEARARRVPADAPRHAPDHDRGARTSIRSSGSSSRSRIGTTLCWGRRSSSSPL